MGATSLALVAGGLTVLSSLSQTNAANAQAKYQQAQAQANAAAARNQAQITAEKGRIEAENLDRERNALTRQYADAQSGTVANLGALGVDMSSGSAVKVLQGNANAYAADVADNRYQKSVSQWVTNENVKAQEANAANYDNAASYYGSTVKSLGQSLLTAGVSGLASGLASGLGAYSITGGSGAGALSQLGQRASRGVFGKALVGG